MNEFNKYLCIVVEPSSQPIPFQLPQRIPSPRILLVFFSFFVCVVLPHLFESLKNNLNGLKGYKGNHYSVGISFEIAFFTHLSVPEIHLHFCLSCNGFLLTAIQYLIIGLYCYVSIMLLISIWFSTILLPQL